MNQKYFMHRIDKVQRTMQLLSFYRQNKQTQNDIAFEPTTDVGF